MQNNSFKVAIIDYEMGNLFSVKHACEFVGLHPVITTNKNEIFDADAAILPGVGAFGDAMMNLKKLDLIQPIRDFIASKKPFLGICLGMQLLFDESEEFGIHQGLGVIKGNVLKFPTKNMKGQQVKVPQIGWNQVFFNNNANGIFSPLKDIQNGEFMYFVHSFYVNPANKQSIYTSTIYEGIDYCSSVLQDNIFACQFHPEKSAAEGIKIYTNWVKIIKNIKEMQQ